MVNGSHIPPIPGGQQAESDDLPDRAGEVGVEIFQPLGEVADPVPIVELGPARPEKFHLTSRGGDQPEDGLDKGALARTVRTDNAEVVAGLNAERDGAQYFHTAVAAADVVKFQQIYLHSRPFRRFARFSSIRPMYVTPLSRSCRETL